MVTQHKTLDEYMELSYRTYFKEDICGSDPCVVGYNPELQGCMAQGSTWQEANDNLKVVRREYIALLLELGWDIPIPKNQPEFSTIPQISLRIPSPIISIQNLETVAA